jgi:hypothetical protein
MRPSRLTLAMTLLLVLTIGPRAVAQYPGAFSANNRIGPAPIQPPPIVSPYANLTLGGPNNFFLRTIPDIQNQNFQGAVQQAWPPFGGYATTPGLNQAILFGDVPTLSQTGHLSAFGAYGFYYNYPVQLRPYYPLNPMQQRMLMTPQQ